MLFLSNEDAVLIIHQQLSADDYAAGALLLEQALSPATRPAVRGIACAAGAALSASTAPLSLREYGTMWIPLFFMALFAGLAVWTLLFQPQRKREEKLREFSDAPLLGLETEIAVYRDFFLIKNQYEEWQEYWTEFSACLETERFVAAVGGSGKRFLVQKDGLSQADRDLLSQTMQNIFAFSYHRSRAKGGGRHG